MSNFPTQMKKIEIPYLPKMPKDEEKEKYTLVLDLDETLIHYEEVIAMNRKYML